jgi:hypothetical protein
MSISLDTIRVGKRYYLINHGERHEFIVLEKLTNQNFKVKDLYTLEIYELQDLIHLGKGKDYELYGME